MFLNLLQYYYFPHHNLFYYFNFLISILHIMLKKINKTIKKPELMLFEDS